MKRLYRELRLLGLIFLICLACLGVGLAGSAVLLPQMRSKEERQMEKTELLEKEQVKPESMATLKA